MELGDCTTQELYDELWDRSCGNIAMFTNADVRMVSRMELGVSPDPDEVERVWLLVGDTLRYRMIETGHRMLVEAVQAVLG